MGDLPTLNRNAVSEPGSAKRAGMAAPAAPMIESGEVDVDISESAAPESPAAPQAASKPNQPAPTVMFEAAVHSDPSLAALGQRGVGLDEVGTSEPAEESEPPAEPSPRPTPTRTKIKGKQMPRKIYKPKSGLTGKRGSEDDEAEPPKSSSSKTGLIIFLVLVVCGALIVGVVLMRGKGKREDASAPDKSAATKAKPIAEPAPSEEPAALAPREPAAPAKPARPEPAAAEKPARPSKPVAEKPAGAEKPAHADKPKPEAAAPAAEPKAPAGKPNEEDFRRANEAYQRGNAKLFAGNTTEAIAEFSMALRLNPKDPANHRALGLAYEKAGKASEATKHLKLYLKAAPKASDRAMVEKKLDQLHGK
jgi:hypothetical protein